MRQIKFRGKQKSWVYGGISILNDEATIFDENCVVNSAYEVGIKTVGQFTGFKTMNESEVYDESKEIYEGDIFKLKGSETKYLVMFENGRWIGKSSDGDEWGKFTCEICNVRKSIIIIGNQTDNPEYRSVGF